VSDDGGWDEFADGWDDDPASIAYPEAAFGSLVEVIVDRPRPFEGARILDFGCGTGLLTHQLVDRVAAIDAMDTSPAMLDVLRAKCERRGWTNVRMLGELPPAGIAPLCGRHVCSMGLGTGSCRRGTARTDAGGGVRGVDVGRP
jgi:SAM-dependent methyltransferase